MSVGVHENRPSEGPFYRVCGKVHAGMTLLMLLSASVSRTATEKTLFMLAKHIYSFVQLTRQYSSRRSSTELHDSCFTKRASSSGAVDRAYRLVDHHRSPKLGGCGIDDGYDIIHHSTSGEVARPLPVIAAQPAPMLSSSPSVADGSSILAGKPSEPFRAAWYPLSYGCHE